MTEMTSSADKVALVQTATMLPVMLIALLAGVRDVVPISGSPAGH